MRFRRVAARACCWGAICCIFWAPAGGLADWCRCCWWLRDAPPLAGAIAARWFSPLGKLCIAALSLSAAYQGWVLVASIPGLVGTAYGWVVLGKIVLFGVLLGFAAANRYRFAPALLRADPPAAKRVLVRSILVQVVLRRRDRDGGRGAQRIAAVGA
ncbi:MAG: CopD family protein [Rhodospirillales bacterium]